MTILVLTIGVLVFGVAVVQLALACAPDRSVGQLLYETEHPQGARRSHQ